MDTIPTYGYGKKDEAKLFYLAEGEQLPDGYYDHPAKVPGSKAEKKHREDAEAEGAKVLWAKSAKHDETVTIESKDTADVKNAG
jgi:hypothetical protein